MTRNAKLASSIWNVMLGASDARETYSAPKIICRVPAKSCSPACNRSETFTATSPLRSRAVVSPDAASLTNRSRMARCSVPGGSSALHADRGAHSSTHARMAQKSSVHVRQGFSIETTLSLHSCRAGLLLREAWRACHRFVMGSIRCDEVYSACCQFGPVSERNVDGMSTDGVSQ